MLACDSHTSRRTLQVWSKLSCSQFQSILDSTGNTLSPSSALQGSTRDSDCAYFLGRSSRRRDAGTRCRVRARTEYCLGRKAILPSFWRVLIQTSVRGLPAGRKVPVCRIVRQDCRGCNQERAQRAATVPGRGSRGQDTAAGSVHNKPTILCRNIGDSGPAARQTVQAPSLHSTPLLTLSPAMVSSLTRALTLLRRAQRDSFERSPK